MEQGPSSLAPRPHSAARVDSLLSGEEYREKERRGSPALAVKVPVNPQCERRLPKGLEDVTLIEVIRGRRNA